MVARPGSGRLDHNGNIWRAVERDLIRTRTAEGRSRAQGATLAELARSYHVGKTIFATGGMSIPSYFCRYALPLAVA
jgi:hypothetical protein